MTRAKQSLVLLGDPQAFEIGLNTKGQERLTQLNGLLTFYFGNHQVDNESADILTTENKIINNETLDEQEQAIIDESQKI